MNPETVIYTGLLKLMASGYLLTPTVLKLITFGGNIGITKQELKNGKKYNFYFFQNLRLNDKLSFGLDLIL